MARKSDDPVAEAIAETERELFAGAFDKEERVEDDTGDTSREEMQDESIEAEESAGDEPEAGAEKSAKDDGKETDDEADGDRLRGKDGKFVAKDKDEKSAAKDGDKDAKDESDEAATKDAADTEEPVADKAASDGKADGKVPPGRLREQTERARAAEVERDAARAEAATVRDEVKALTARFDGMLAVLQRQQAPQPKADESKAEIVPDMFEDPKGYQDYQERRVQNLLAGRDQQIQELRIETSMQIADGRHGETFSKAYEAVGKLDRQNPDDQVTVRRIWNSPNPGEALVTWHRNQETLREVGNDPAKFKEKIAAETREALMKDPEFRKQLLEGLREEASGANADGKPRTTTRLPKSLNGASGGKRDADDSAPIDDSDSALFQGAFERA